MSGKPRLRVHISGVTKCVTKFLTLSKSPHCDSVKNFVTHFVTAEIWTPTHDHDNHFVCMRYYSSVINFRFSLGLGDDVYCYKYIHSSWPCVPAPIRIAQLTH